MKRCYLMSKNCPMPKPRSPDVIWQLWRAARDRLYKHATSEYWYFRNHNFVMPETMLPGLRRWHLDRYEELLNQREAALLDHHIYWSRHRATKNKKRKRNYRGGN